ncbi:porin family protein [Mucilaginibacter segetis]|uniref:Long-subunit fatty acid transport protein n=1 Tax=Mucilaginibacter segetis TaxID=2793071 RepID=A0A934ULM8_9SPHI|nr:hypothetical protein [Mucilaginibacter segetis]MBK0378007.1 hypothetical protein [Mucilaginibacter segetis]
MIRYIKATIIFLLTTVTYTVSAQSTSTTSSPYSKYGIGDIIPSVLPQNVAMGGIATATNSINGFSIINPLNPASYSKITLTAIDVGLYSKINTLSKVGQTDQTNTSFRLNHIAFGIPVSKRSALSFGLLPYSELGYSYRQVLNSGFGTGLPADTNAVNYIYSGDGGLSKLYLGYGFGIGSHLSIGANASYIFGNLKQSQSTEIPVYGNLNSRIEESNSVGGLNYDYGIQYSVDFSLRKHLTFGYSASANTKLNNQNSYIVSSYFTDAGGNEGVPTDSIINRQNAKTKIQLPQINHFGISFQDEGKYLVGADYTMGKWSNLTIGGENQGLRDSKTFNIGGQFTPNINAINGYFSRVDYRLGVILDDTYIHANNTDIKSYAATFGVGLPLRPNNRSYYKINISAEIGKRGTIANQLVKESFVNLHVSFTLNDKWFERYKFD